MMKKTKLAIAISLLSVGGMISVAAARDDRGGRPGPGMHHKHFGEQFDTNKDGKLDDAERAALHKAMEVKHAERKAKVLAQFDANRNGVIDDAERQQMMELKAAERFAKIDTNRDGSISLAEFKAGSKLRHKRSHMGPPGAGGPPRGAFLQHDLDDDED